MNIYCVENEANSKQKEQRQKRKRDMTVWTPAATSTVLLNKRNE